MKFLTVALVLMMLLFCSLADPVPEHPCLTLCNSECGVSSTICRAMLPMATQFCDVKMNFCSQACQAMCGAIDPKFAAIFASFSTGLGAKAQDPASIPASAPPA